MYKAPINEIKFLLKNLFQTNELFKDKKSSLFDEETLDGILDQVSKLSENLISPMNRDGDMKPAFLDDGKVILPKSFSKAYKSIAEGGWVGISGSTKYGGLGLPLIVTTCVNEILSSACLSLALNPLMTQGQIDALESHANEDIKRLSAATYDVSEYVVGIAKNEGLADGLEPAVGGVTVHLACHARAQNMGPKAAEMLRLIPDMNVEIQERCSGHGGSWGIMKNNFETAMKIGAPIAKKVAESPGKFVVSECPLAREHIMQGVERLDGTGKPETNAIVQHPIQILAKAYGIET